MNGRGGKNVSPGGERFGWERSNPTDFPSKGGLDEVLRRYFLLNAEYTHALFNPAALEQQTGLASAGKNVNTS
ncbi:hypothetical protein KSF_014120 [Reticulibacter mediterranei]|uniref:Uncharacterized protein n=1 Tax=Reticulibacter mediterranei TaxID=2778369 RepID=A0A8J3I9H7_9CHLR|nr:hypothetical protein KSF_014120 [Reticulibacter mediterranei]